jgi:hypothetical protein
MKEPLPPLRWRASSPGHILSHGGLADFDAELEQLAMNSWRSPQGIGDAHLADQPAYFQRHRGPAATRSRLPTPVRFEPGAMPADNGVRLNDRQRIANFREQPIETNEYQLVDGTEGEFPWSSPPQNIYLLPQRPNLCFKRCPRPEKIDDRPTNKSAKIPHPATGLPNSRSTASRIRFATGTGNDWRPADAARPLNELGDTQDQRFSESWRYNLHANREAIAREACRNASGR